MSRIEAAERMEQARQRALQAQGKAAYEYFLRNIDPGHFPCWDDLNPGQQLEWTALVNVAEDAFFDELLRVPA